MSAEVLRKAAALMRERAEAATQGPWESLDNGDRVIAWSTEPEPPHFTEDFEYVIDEPMENAANAEHIASWHPAVALAVADLLLRAAAARDLGEDDNWPPQVAAIAVARAYLGESA